MGKIRRVETPTDKYKLVLFPTSLECPQGEACRLYKSRCFLSYHHLYFYRRVFEMHGPDSLPYLLRHNHYNIIPIARCRHDEYEEKYRPLSFPKLKVIKDHLHQADQLDRLGDLAIDLAGIDLELENIYCRDIPGEHEVLRLKEQYEQSDEEIRVLGSQVLQFELLQRRAIENPFDYTHLDDSEPLRERALEIVSSTLTAKTLDIAA